MPKIKIPRKSTNIDMTAMTDVAFLLLTFFMLATKFAPEEPVAVDTPSSISEIPLPESGMLQILVDKDGKVFYGIDGQQVRYELLKKMGEKYNIPFTEDEAKTFALVATFGVPMNQMKEFLALKSEERAKLKQPGIPCDSVTNELGDWIWQTRLLQNEVRVAIKADGRTAYPKIKEVIATVQEKKVNRFNLITSMEKGDSR